MIHIGLHIKQVIETKEVSISAFAKEINKSRTVVYHIFTRQSIDTNLLMAISKALDYNFFQLYFPQEESPKTVNEPSSGYEESFKVKYYSLLEKYNRLLEKMVRRE